MVRKTVFIGETFRNYLARQKLKQNEWQFAASTVYAQGVGREFGQSLTWNGSIVDNEIAASDFAMVNQMKKGTGAIVHVHRRRILGATTETVNRLTGKERFQDILREPGTWTVYPARKRGHDGQPARDVAWQGFDCGSKIRSPSHWVWHGVLVTHRRPALPVITRAGDIDDPPRLCWVDCMEQRAIHLEPADAILPGACLGQAATKRLRLREMDNGVGVR